MITVETICAAEGVTVHVPGDPTKVVEKVVVGDLLSFIMGSDAEGAAWITIQSHLNVAAVAVLKEMPLIVVAAGREPAADLKERCRLEGITLVTAAESIFDFCLRLGHMGLRG